MPYTLTRYTLEDIPEMVVAIEQFLFEDRGQGFENYFKDIKFDEEKIINLLISNVNNLLFFTNIIKDDEGKIRGGLSAMVCQFIFSRETLATDQFLYIDPEFKNVKALIELIKSYEDWAKARNVKEIQLTSSSGFKQDVFNKMIARRGFKPFAIGYSKRF